jgi:hypothetical protein
MASEEKDLGLFIISGGAGSSFLGRYGLNGAGFRLGLTIDQSAITDLCMHIIGHATV